VEDKDLGNDVEKTVKLRDYKRKRFLLNKLKAKKIPPRLYAYLCEKLVINKPTPAEEIQVLQIMPEEKHIDYARINLPNLNIAGEGYDIDIKKFLPESFLAKNELNEAETFDISIVSDNGEHVLITFDANTYRFTCVTESPGEYDFILVRKVTGNDIIEIHSMPMHLIVNPDPKTLWKNIPSDSTDPYYKPDVDFRIISCGDSHSLIGASKRGRSHAQDGRFRDDDFEMFYDKDLQYAVIAVADGAGSAKFSRKGSQIAVTTAVNQIKSYAGKEFWGKIETYVEKWQLGEDEGYNNLRALLYKNLIVNAAFQSKQNIELERARLIKLGSMALANSNNILIDIKDYATTLLISVAKRMKQGWFVASYWVGDGGIGIYNANENKVIVQGEPDVGTYGGQTRFLTMNEVWGGTYDDIVNRRLRFNFVDNLQYLVLMSDGVTDPIFETENNLNKIEVWHSLWNEMGKMVDFSTRDVSTAKALLDWLDFWSPGNHDDRTIVIMY
jgi:serine/threonine protein phosphatase PrpC